MNLKVFSRGVRRRSLMLLLLVALMAALVPTAAFAAAGSHAPASNQRHYHRPAQRPHYHQHYHQHYHYHQHHWSCATTYRVKKGDTLSKVSRHFHVPVMKLANANGIKNVNRIYTGQHLCIPH